MIRKSRDRFAVDAGANNVDRLLTGESLLAALETGRVFRASTWSGSRVRSTAYDLAVAPNLCIVPVDRADGGREHIRVARDEIGFAEITLRPGESAFVSTVERLSLAWSFSGTVGSKFSVAARGLFVLTGSWVDPGFGLQKEEQTGWVAKQDERLHFVLANIGPEAITIRTGVDPIASLQLREIPAVPEGQRVAIESRGFREIESRFMTPNLGSQAPILAYFKQVYDLQEKVAYLTQAHKDSTDRAEEALRGVNTVVLFGIYLVAITVLGVFLSVLSGGVEDWVSSSSGPAAVLAALVLGGMGLSLIALTCAAVRALWQIRPAGRR